MAGQIVKRGDSWQVRIYLGKDANGKRKYFNKTIHGSKKDAQKFLTAKLREKDLGVFIEPASMLLNEYLDKWLEEVAKPRLRDSTFSSYEAVLKNYVKSKFQSKKLSDIQAYDVQTLYNEMMKRGLSSRTVRYTHNVLLSALNQAIKWRLLNQNPCSLCDLPRLEKTEMKYFSPDETKVFLEIAKESKHYAIFLLAIECGMRPSEYLSLQWKDLDFENKVLTVRRAIAWNRKGGGFKFTEPKTKKSRRSIPISNSTLQVLKSHRRKQLELKFKLGNEYEKLDLIFATEIGTPLQPKNLLDRHFRPILKVGALPDLRLYDLRHTMATLLLSAGENPKVVSERLGHASIVLTLDTYSHVLPTMQENATNKLENLMFGT